jgi:hypothetical protein
MNMVMKMESGASDQEMKRDIVSQEASRNAMFGDIEVTESSSEEEIGKFLEVYQNAVIANLDAEARGIYKKAERNLAEQDRFAASIADWDGKEGGEGIVASHRDSINALSEAHVGLVGGTPDNSEGSVGEINRKLDQAIHIREALAANRGLFVNKYRSQVAALKASNPVLAELQSLEG